MPLAPSAAEPAEFTVAWLAAVAAHAYDLARKSGRSIEDARADSIDTVHRALRTADSLAVGFPGRPPLTVAFTE